MKPAAVQIISYGGATARVSRRADGLFAVRWREAKKGRSTTSTTREGAVDLAKKKVRELAGKSGARLVTVIEAEAVEQMKNLIGARSLSSAVEQLKDAVQRTGGWQHIGKAVEAYLKAGHGKILRTPMSEAVSSFLRLHERSAPLYLAGLRKELEAFTTNHGEVMVCDLDETMLRPWIGRSNLDGSEPGARFFNNRLATWKTFLNRCREWGMLARDGKHPGETIKRQKEEDKVPEIWPVEVARKALKAVLAEEPQSLAYLVLGCWMELRHFMIELVSLVNGLETTAAARRMIGEAEPLKPQEPVDDTPLFVAAAAAKAAPPPEALERRMLAAHWREGDHTQDPQQEGIA